MIGMSRLFPAGALAVAAGRLRPAGATKSSAAASGGPAGVGEADQIRQRVIAEHARDLGAAGADAVRRVQPLGLLDVAAGRRA